MDVEEVPRGSVVVTDQHWSATALFEAVVSLESDVATTITPRTRLRLHAGASEAGCRLASVTGPPDSQTLVLARIATDSPVTLRGGDRFVLRLPAPLRTIGGGVVVDPYARRRALHDDPHQIELLARSAPLDSHSFSPLRDCAGLHRRDVPIRVGCTPAEVNHFIDETGACAGAHNLFAPVAVEEVMASVGESSQNTRSGPLWPRAFPVERSGKGCAPTTSWSTLRSGRWRIRAK